MVHPYPAPIVAVPAPRLSVRLAAAASLALGLLGGCSQADPETPMDSSSSGTSSEDTEPTAVADYMPLVDGASWTYRHTTDSLEVWDEEVMFTAITWQGMPAFEARDNAGSNGESTTSVHIALGTQVLRVHKDVDLAGMLVQSVDYDPGFLRADNAWREGDSEITTYDRTEYDATGAVVDTSPRNQQFTVEAVDVEVTVPAGTFTCIQVLRERIETGEAKRFWFADGVGKVKHENITGGGIEELAEYSIP